MHVKQAESILRFVLEVGGGAAVEETLVTHAERVTGGKRSCEGAAVTACTVAGRVGVAHCGGNMTPAKSAVMPQEHARR